jgi:hypothetical protein
MVGQRHLARRGHLPAADQPHLGHGVAGAQNGRAVTAAGCRPLRPATRWVRGVSRASTSVIARQMGVSRRAGPLVKIHFCGIGTILHFG